MTARSQPEAGPAMVATRSGMLRAAKSNIAARRKEKARMVATNARPCAEPCMVKTAKRMKMATSADQRASVGKRPSWRAAGNVSIVARGQGSACAAPTALASGVLADPALPAGLTCAAPIGAGSSWMLTALRV